jgi:hypothetical protein
VTNKTFIYTTQTTFHFAHKKDIEFQKSSAVPGTPGPLTAVQIGSLTVQMQTRTVRKYNWKIKLLFSHLRRIKLLIYQFSHLLN